LLPFGITDLEFSLVTFISAFVGTSIIIFSSKWISPRLLAAFAIGVYLWYFTDTLAGANFLDVNNGLTLSFGLASLVFLFAIGLLVFLGLGGNFFSRNPAGTGVLVALLAALALGIHGMAEGVDFGFTASQTPRTSLLDAFGGLAPSVSWVIHKMLEPTVAASCYVALTGPKGRNASGRLEDALALSVVFVTPAIVGSIAGYFNPIDTTYIYALGLGASVFALVRVGRALYAPEDGSQALLSMKVGAAALVGFILIFISALLHS
jgi:hypothetical protein